MYVHTFPTFTPVRAATMGPRLETLTATCVIPQIEALIHRAFGFLGGLAPVINGMPEGGGRVGWGRKFFSFGDGGFVRTGRFLVKMYLHTVRPEACSVRGMGCVCFFLGDRGAHRLCA
jgi:hypothetical protein